jgi:hypothetical protein
MASHPATQKLVATLSACVHSIQGLSSTQVALDPKMFITAYLYLPLSDQLNQQWAHL